MTGHTLQQFSDMVVGRVLEILKTEESHGLVPFVLVDTSQTEEPKMEYVDLEAYGIGKIELDKVLYIAGHFVGISDMVAKREGVKHGVYNYAFVGLADFFCVTISRRDGDKPIDITEKKECIVIASRSLASDDFVMRSFTITRGEDKTVILGAEIWLDNGEDTRLVSKDEAIAFKNGFADSATDAPETNKRNVVDMTFASAMVTASFREHPERRN